jgi:hypothetical protein
MKSRPLYLSALLCTLFFSSIPGLHAEPETRVDHIRAAYEALQSAQRSNEPLPFMETAKREIEAAKEGKGGSYLSDAVKCVNEAISARKSGKREKADAKIARAIEELSNNLPKSDGKAGSN